MRMRFAAISSLLVIVLASAFGQAKGKNSSTTAQGVFRDSGDRIASDGGGAYIEDRTGACTASVVHNNGQYFLRTVVSTCTRTRSMKLDFNGRIGGPPADCTVDDPADPTTSLNICGANEEVPDVRFIAGTLFSDTTSSTPVTLYISMKSNGDFVGAQSFQLEFEANVPVTAGNASFRELTAGATAAAELYVNQPQGKKTVKVSLGRYNMPFQLTVTKDP